MFNIILFEPEIPQNTGNIIRLCANTGCQLHLIQPLGFPLEDAKLKRAGLDYHEYAHLKLYQNWLDFQNQHLHIFNLNDGATPLHQQQQIFALTTHGKVEHFKNAKFNAGDFFLFGNEGRGLPQTLREGLPETSKLRLPMQANSRSLNLANSVSILIYNAWAQHGFLGGC
jgi:tRNA (cytidine/uridine-2'-O-)-methyltransferase